MQKLGVIGNILQTVSFLMKVKVTVEDKKKVIKFQNVWQGLQFLLVLKSEENIWARWEEEL